MTNLKLITIENFGELQCNFYRNMNDDILLTREQIGTALEYSNPSTAIKNLHRKHKDRLDSLSMKIKLGRLQNEPTSKSDEQERVYYTERGVMEICRWSRQPKANLFMDWVWDIVEKYRNKEIVDITLLSSTLNKMVSILEKQEERITKVESQLSEPLQVEEKPAYKKPYNPWFAKMQPKYQLLEDYFDITRGQLYKNILKEMENIYNIDTNQIQADYLYENNITSCYPLDPYEFKQKYRDMVEGIVNDNLIQYGIASEDDPITSTKHITIFNKTLRKHRKERNYKNEIYRIE